MTGSDWAKTGRANKIPIASKIEFFMVSSSRDSPLGRMSLMRLEYGIELKGLSQPREETFKPHQRPCYIEAEVWKENGAVS